MKFYIEGNRKEYKKRGISMNSEVEEVEKIYLTLTDDRELECDVIGAFEVGDFDYIALLPVEEEKVLLYRFKEDEENIELINIEDDEEFDEASKVFYKEFGEEDIDSITDEE